MRVQKIRSGVLWSTNQKFGATISVTVGRFYLQFFYFKVFLPAEIFIFNDKMML